VNDLGFDCKRLCLDEEEFLFPLWQRGIKGDFFVNGPKNFLDYRIKLKQNLPVVVTQYSQAHLRQVLGAAPVVFDLLRL